MSALSSYLIFSTFMLKEFSFTIWTFPCTGDKLKLSFTLWAMNRLSFSCFNNRNRNHYNYTQNKENKEHTQNHINLLLIGYYITEEGNLFPFTFKFFGFFFFFFNSYVNARYCESFLFPVHLVKIPGSYL